MIRLSGEVCRESIIEAFLVGKMCWPLWSKRALSQSKFGKVTWPLWSKEALSQSKFGKETWPLWSKEAFSTKILKSDMATMVQRGFSCWKFRKAIWPLWSKEAFHIENVEKPFSHYGPRRLFHCKISGRRLGHLDDTRRFSGARVESDCKYTWSRCKVSFFKRGPHCVCKMATISLATLVHWSCTHCRARRH